jgi:hypothetical protein
MWGKAKGLRWFVQLLISAAKHQKHQHGLKKRCRYRWVPGQAVAGHVAMCCRTANNLVVAVHFVGEKRAHGRVYDKQDKCLPLQAIAEEYAPSACFNQISKAKTHLKTILVKPMRTISEFEHRISGSVLQIVHMSAKTQAR